MQCPFTNPWPWEAMGDLNAYLWSITIKWFSQFQPHFMAMHETTMSWRKNFPLPLEPQRIVV